MGGCIFGGKHGTQSEAPAVLCIVGDGDAVGFRLIADGVDARHLAFADGADGQFLGAAVGCSTDGTVGSGERAFHPGGLAVQVLQDAFGEGDGCAARCVELVDVVCLGHAHLVVGEVVHDACQVLVHGREDGHAQAEVRRPEERPSLFTAEAAHLVGVCIHPARAARHDLHSGSECLHAVSVGSLRCGELDGYVGRAESFRLEVLRVVHVDDGHNLVSEVPGNLLNGLAHLSVSYQCYFHLIV